MILLWLLVIELILEDRLEAPDCKVFTTLFPIVPTLVFMVLIALFTVFVKLPIADPTAVVPAADASPVPLVSLEEAPWPDEDELFKLFRISDIRF